MKPSKSSINKKNPLVWLRYLLSILAWGQTGVFFEYPAEIALVSEAGGHGNINYRIVRIGQKTLAFFNTDHIQVFFKRGTCGLFKEGRKISRIQMNVIRHLFQCKFTGKIVGNI